MCEHAASQCAASGKASSVAPWQWSGMNPKSSSAITRGLARYRRARCAFFAAVRAARASFKVNGAAPSAMSWCRGHARYSRPRRLDLSGAPVGVSMTMLSFVTAITRRSPIKSAAPVRSMRDQRGGAR